MEFKKFNKIMKKDGIRFKDNFNLWFHENIPTADENHDDQDNDLDHSVSAIANSGAIDAIKILASVAADVIDPSVSGTGTGLVNTSPKKVRGFIERFRKKDSAKDVHTNKMPSKEEEEAMLHLDLCVDYMEIIDKALVDEVPKIYIMMLVHKSLYFLGGVDSQRTPLWR